MQVRVAVREQNVREKTSLLLTRLLRSKRRQHEEESALERSRGEKASVCLRFFGFSRPLREIMSIRGIFQLTKLTFVHCPHTGTSKGINQFLVNALPSLRVQTEERRGEDHKNVFEIQQRKGKDPYLHAMFVNKREKTIGVKNKTEEEIAILVENVMSEKGRTVKKIPRRVMRTRISSVQGTWQPQGAATSSSST